MAVVTGSKHARSLAAYQKPVAAPAPMIPKEVAAPLRRAMEHMVEALPQENNFRAAVFSKGKNRSLYSCFLFSISKILRLWEVA